MNTKKILKGMNISERYQAILQFKQGAFKVINPAIPSVVKQDKLLSLSTLKILGDIKTVIEEDIKSLYIQDIDIEDIVSTYKEKELSNFISKTIYLWTLGSLEKDYKNCKKAEKLNNAYPVESRKADLEELQKRIVALEESVDTLKDIDASLVKNQVDKLEELRGRKQSIERTFDYKKEEQIKNEVYTCTLKYLENILDGVQENIHHIERNL